MTNDEGRRASTSNRFRLSSFVSLALAPERSAGATVGPSSSSQEILEGLEKTNLFVVPLDHHGEWYRYHHLFQELLAHKLRAETTEAQRTALHATAGADQDNQATGEGQAAPPPPKPLAPDDDGLETMVPEVTVEKLLMDCEKM